MKKYTAYYVFLTLIVSFSLSKTFAQHDIALGAWRSHISYTHINSIAVGNTKIYASTNDAIMTLDKSDNSINSYSKLNGLSATGISAINYNQSTDQLLVGYEDGNLDIIKDLPDNTVVNFARLKNLSGVSQGKQINHISFFDNHAYLSTDYGIVVFDMRNNEVKETWRDLGESGTKLKVYESTFLGDSIFLATELGILGGNRNANLLDYNNWKRFSQSPFNKSINHITAFNGRLYATLDDTGIFRYEQGTWTLEDFLQGKTFYALTSTSQRLLITEGVSVWKLNTSNQLSSVIDSSIEQPLYAIEDEQENTWIGDAQRGLIFNRGNIFTAYLPNGPANASCFKLVYANNAIYSMAGGYSSSFQPLERDKGYDVYANGLWTNVPSQSKDLTSIAFGPSDNYYISSFGYGVEAYDGKGNVHRYDDGNSTLVNTNPPTNSVNITAVETSAEGLWVANYGTLNALHLLSEKNIWQSFSFPLVSASRYPLDLLVDNNNYVWLMLNPSQGGVLVFDRAKNKSVYLSDQVTAGGLPDKSVNCMAMDRDGYVWLGTNSGVAYFIDSYNVFVSEVDAVKPIFENRYLLKGEKITAITVDAANRKWIGTQKGVWLFNATGEILINNFTEDNSPLLSNVINDIAINANTGEVFFATAKGIVSYRGDATESISAFQDIKIFPNPVTHAFTGTVAISGLVNDASIKITDISGKLVWQTQANGGTATWNLYDYAGRHAATGIYLVFAASADGSESAIGKIAVIE
jgi:hypothetical protein